MTLLRFWQDRHHHAIGIDQRYSERIGKSRVPHGRLAGPVVACQDEGDRARAMRLLEEGPEVGRAAAHALTARNLPSTRRPIARVPSAALRITLVGSCG